MKNKSPETDISVQAKDQKGQTASHWLLLLPQTKMGDPTPPNPQTETKDETCLLPFYIPL